MYISEEYKKQCEDLHSADDSWGQASVTMAPFVSAVINKMEIDTVLDYGAGKCRLGASLRVNRDISLTNYDPGIPEIADEPEPHQMVACIDVLEHIEPDYIDNVLKHIAALTEVVAFVSISCVPAVRILPDGRNAHILLEPCEWWLAKLREHFTLGAFNGSPEHFFILLTPKVSEPDKE